MPSAPPQATGKVTFGKVTASKIGHKFCLYGTGGIGKTTLGCYAPAPVGYVDIEQSLDKLSSQLPEDVKNNVMPLTGITDYAALRTALRSDGWESIKTIVIDSATVLEQMIVRWVIDNIPHEKGKSVQINSIDDYGFGKGYTLVYEEFNMFLSLLDKHVQQGRNVILIAHECISNVPNPAGEDWIRYEPRLQSPASGKSSIRLRLKEWVDHCVFLAYDIAVNKDNKAIGGASRTLYCSETPSCMGKSRTVKGSLCIDEPNSTIWNEFLK